MAAVVAAVLVAVAEGLVFAVVTPYRLRRRRGPAAHLAVANLLHQICVRPVLWPTRAGPPRAHGQLQKRQFRGWQPRAALSPPAVS